MSQILREVFPDNPIGILTGPNHAEEIAEDLVTCAVVASEDPELAEALQELFTLPHFRVYTSDDVAGIELGGAVKNVYAIAAGMAHGLGLGDNAVAALVTRALAEMTRLGVALGGRPGNLRRPLRRRRSHRHLLFRALAQPPRGPRLGTGKSLEEAVASLGMVAEGVPNTLSIHEAARKAGVRTPIIDAVYSDSLSGQARLRRHARAARPRSAAGKRLRGMPTPSSGQDFFASVSRIATKYRTQTTTTAAMIHRASCFTAWTNCKRSTPSPFLRASIC